MTEVELKSLKKLYYSIGEVAAMFSVNTSLIRFWEKEFDFEASKKTAKGNRLYALKEIENFNKIYHLVKEEGFTLDGAKKALKSSKKNSSNKQNKTSESIHNQEEIISKLEKIKQKLLKLKD